MAKKSKILRKGYSLLSIVMSICLLVCAIAVPMNVSAETSSVDTPSIIVAEDKFDSLDGWNYTAGKASVQDGKLNLNTGYNETTALGYLQNVITRNEQYVDQSVTVEVPCADIAAGNLPAIWLRVQEAADGTKSGYVLTYDKTQFGITKWATNLTSTAMTSVGTAFKASYDAFSTYSDDSLRITFSAVGTNPTVLTVAAEYVNNNISYGPDVFEDSTAAYQTAGTVGLSGISAEAGGTVGFDNFAYKSTVLNETVTDDFYRSEKQPIGDDWITYPSKDLFAINNDKLEMTIDTNAIAINKFRIQRPMKEAGVDQSVTIKVSASEIAALKFPVLYLRVQNDSPYAVPVGYAMKVNGYNMYFSKVTYNEDGTASEVQIGDTQLWRIMDNIALYNYFVITFSATSDGNGGTVLSASAYADITTNDSGSHSDHIKPFTSVTDTTAELQNAGTVAISGFESSSAEGPHILALDYIKYTADGRSHIDMAGKDIDSSWEAYPDVTSFAKTGGKLQINAPTVITSDRYLKRPMSEARVNQTASITTNAADFTTMAAPVLWLRVQNNDGSAPVGYYCYYSNRVMHIGKATSGGSATDINTTDYNIYDYTLYDSFTYNFTAKTDEDGKTNLTFQIIGNITAGGTNPKTITFTDDTEELQNAGTVAISAFENGNYSSENVVNIDNFSYTAGDISYTDNFEDEAGIGNGWIAHPDETNFILNNDKLEMTVLRELMTANKLQRPMSEKAVNQTASITTNAVEFSKMGRSVLWLRVQNEDASATPVGYYCYFVGNVMYIGKATSDGTATDISTIDYRISDYTLYDSFTYNFTAETTEDGKTNLTFQIVGNVISGNPNIKVLTATDDTAELQNAGTVAVTGYQTAWNVAQSTLIIDDFSYTRQIIGNEIEEEINIVSLVRLKKYLAGITGYIGSYADYNSDGYINAKDLAALRKHILGTELIGGNVITDTEITGAASAASTKYKTDILNLADTVKATGTTYYVSADGNDSNDGKTPETALKTPEAVNDLSLKSGDAVLLNRGDVFRITESVNLLNGVSYGAYGEGDKPAIYGSLKDYADKSLWTSDDYVIWKTTVNGPEAGNIVFDGGASFGVYKPESLEDVKQNGDYYYERNEDNKTGTVYLRLKGYNPGEYFDSIEISSTENAFYKKSNLSNAIIENIEMKYFAQFGVNVLNASDIKISGCEIAYIGGGLQDDQEGNRTTPLTQTGNGINFFLSAQNCVVKNNYLYQIFDAAITFQTTGAGFYKGFKGFDITDNLIEKCEMNFEFWIANASELGIEKAIISDIDFTNNILRFGGYGFGSAEYRKTKTPHAFILGWDGEYNADQIVNFNITGNTFDCTKYHFSRTACIDLINVSGNNYYQCDGAVASFKYGEANYPSSAEGLYYAASTIDESPANVGWMNADGTVDLYEQINENYEDSASDPWA